MTSSRDSIAPSILSMVLRSIWHARRWSLSIGEPCVLYYVAFCDILTCTCVKSRRVLPCWDEPAVKAVFGVTLKVLLFLFVRSYLDDEFLLVADAD